MNDLILLVDDDPSAIQIMASTLSSLGNLRFATNGTDALRVIREGLPSVILLDAQMPGMSGLKLFDALKAESMLTDVPIIFVTSHSESAFEISAFEMGAADFIAKPIVAPVLLARVKTHLRIKHMADEMRRGAMMDALTGIASMAMFDNYLERELLRGQRGGDKISLLLINIDDFKSYNQRHGTDKGDECLRRVANLLTTGIRQPSDLAARCGADEFAVLLPQTPPSGAEYVARRIEDAIGALDIRHEGSSTGHRISVSIGVACLDQANAWKEPLAPQVVNDLSAGSRANDLIGAADQALNSAKRAGGARISLGKGVGDVAKPADPFFEASESEYTTLRSA